MTDFLDEKRREITARLNELGPLVDEFHRLTAAISALDGIGRSTASAAATVRRKPGRPRGSGRKAAAETTTAAATTAPATAAPAAPAKRGRPPGRKKVGRPPGRKKVGRPAGRKAGRPPASATATAAAPATRRRAGRRKGSGTRSVQALAFVQGQPGITIPELAVKMGIKQNYLYRVLPALEQEGKIRKQGRGWHPKS